MIIGTFISILTITGCTVVFMAAANTRRQSKKPLKKFHLWTEKLKLKVDSLEIFKTHIIGVDCTAKKLLYIKAGPHTSNPVLIDLNNVINCTYRKVYLKTPPQPVPHPQVNILLNEILLEFDQKDLTTISVPFYKHSSDGRGNTALLETKAWRWEMFLKKLLTPAGPAAMIHPT